MNALFDSNEFHVHGLLVVVAFRKHTDSYYIVGFPTTMVAAETMAEQESLSRGGKYVCKIYGAEDTIRFTDLNNGNG